MRERIAQLTITLNLRLYHGELRSFDVAYVPVSSSRSLNELGGNIEIPAEDLDAHLKERLTRVIEFITSRVAHREFDLRGKVASLSTTLGYVTYFGETATLATALSGGEHLTPGFTPKGDLTDGQQRLLDSVAATAEKMAWDHLAGRLNVPTTPVSSAEVLISYRATKQDFAEALAVRLGREGVVPFFDKWDVKAGDSIPGKIEEAFARSIACVLILSQDFLKGQWATGEMETAITKRIQEDYRVIPVLYEKCDVPELLKPLRHVDFSNHDPQTFESKFGELIDAIYGLELNPFRS